MWLICLLWRRSYCKSIQTCLPLALCQVMESHDFLPTNQQRSVCVSDGDIMALDQSAVTSWHRTNASLSGDTVVTPQMKVLPATVPCSWLHQPPRPASSVARRGAFRGQTWSAGFSSSPCASMLSATASSIIMKYNCINETGCWEVWEI